MNGAIPGQRFVVDLSDEEDEHDATTAANTRANASSSSQPQRSQSPLPMNPLEFIKDIVEREPAAPNAPSLPTFKHKATPAGFPTPKKRVSKFKQSRQVPSTEAFEAFAKTSVPQTFDLPEPAPPAQSIATQDEEVKAGRPGSGGGRREGETQEEEEMRLIDEENTKRLANMSVKEIEEDRNELLSQLDPSLVAMLMKRANKSSASTSTTKAAAPAPPKKVENDIEKYLRSANLDSGRGDTGIEDLGPAPLPPSLDEITKNAVPIPKPRGKPIQPTKAVRWLEEDEKEPDDDEDPLQDSEMKASLQPASEFKPHSPNHDHGEGHAAKCDDPTHDHAHDLSGPAVHFPEPKPAPDLDPTDPDFLENLHSTYFPSLPNDPSKLAWMAPLPSEGSPADLDSSYNPSHPALPASALRFDFRGALLPPSISRAMPTSKGLHHHADAPEAAGYTIPELARLARSTYPAQRCIAFQVLGRLLFRLGKGIFGQGSEMTMGMWRCIEEGKVLDILQQAAANEGGHRSVSAYAQEAVWLWQRGGGKVMGAI